MERSSSDKVEKHFGSILALFDKCLVLAGTDIAQAYQENTMFRNYEHELKSTSNFKIKHN